MFYVLVPNHTLLVTFSFSSNAWRLTILQKVLLWLIYWAMKMSFGKSDDELLEHFGQQINLALELTGICRFLSWVLLIFNILRQVRLAGHQIVLGPIWTVLGELSVISWSTFGGLANLGKVSTVLSSLCNVMTNSLRRSRIIANGFIMGFLKVRWKFVFHWLLNLLRTPYSVLLLTYFILSHTVKYGLFNRFLDSTNHAVIRPGCGW